MKPEEHSLNPRCPSAGMNIPFFLLKDLNLGLTLLLLLFAYLYKKLHRETAVTV